MTKDRLNGLADAVFDGEQQIKRAFSYTDAEHALRLPLVDCRDRHWMMLPDTSRSRDGRLSVAYSRTPKRLMMAAEVRAGVGGYRENVEEQPCALHVRRAHGFALVTVNTDNGDDGPDYRLFLFDEAREQHDVAVAEAWLERP
ncbi:MAG: hypothetical protein ACHREM_00360 [Polyangiales bacterium]